MNTIAIKKEINLNTIVVIVGFLTTFAGIITVWNTIQYKQEDFQKWISAHDQLHTGVANQLQTFAETDSGRDKALLDITFRLGQIEKAEEAFDLRLGRIAENYGNQFTDIRSSLGAISTQLALTNQTLQRLEVGRTELGK